MLLGGGWTGGFVSDDLKSARFCDAYAICADPHNPEGWFIGNYSSVRYCDGHSVSLIAGTDSVAGSPFSDVRGLCCTSDRKRSDRDAHTIRMIDLSSRHGNCVDWISQRGWSLQPISISIPLHHQRKLNSRGNSRTNSRRSCALRTEH